MEGMPERPWQFSADDVWAAKQIKPEPDCSLITGAINPGGTIGPVGGIYEKTEAAGSYGAKLFLVPKGQATYLSESCQESRLGLVIYRTCKSEPKPLSDLTEERFEMKVIEASTVREVLGHFTL